MIRMAGRRFQRLFQAIMPDPFVLAVLLTVLVLAAGTLFGDVSGLFAIGAWQDPGKGFWSLLGFSMQMVLILVTGFAVADSPLARTALSKVATLPTSARSAVFLVSAVSIGGSLLNWGLGLIVGAILAREVGRSAKARGVPVDYSLVVAAGYTGMMTWHGGLSGTAPLMMTTPENVTKFLGAELGERAGVLSFADTVFSVENLVITGGLWVLVPLLMSRLSANVPDETLTMPDALITRPDESIEDEYDGPGGFMAGLDRSPWIAGLTVLLLGAAFVHFLASSGLSSFDPNALNLLFLILGISLHGSLRTYVQSVSRAMLGATGIVLQFPFYAGIMGVMRVTGLGTTLATTFSSIASAKTYGVLTLLSAGFVNLFVPSGGGQWALQGPVAIGGAEALSVPTHLAVLAVAYGDQLTNMLQPFWALPLLAVTGAKARDIVGYTAVAMLFGFLWCGAWLAAFAP